VAVDGLSLDVAAGELFGIVGPDGAGKTTTLRMLAGVLRPTSGSAVIGGIDVTTHPERVKHDLAYMAQRFGLYEDLTVAENLEFYADLYRVPRSQRPARLARLYEFSRLGAFTDRLAGKLSGGMKQKLALSCSLVHRPSLLLLDEPTFGVDPISRRELWLILHEMVADGITIVVTTSYLDEAERCDRVALLDDGRVLAVDTPTALQGSRAGLVFALETDDPRALRDALRETAIVRSAYLFGETVHVRLRPGRTEQELKDTLSGMGPGAGTPKPLVPSLEDVFVDFLGTPEADVVSGATPGPS
jgi:ABC-2 type transport system ATP-binding protein